MGSKWSIKPIRLNADVFCRSKLVNLLILTVKPYVVLSFSPINNNT